MDYNATLETFKLYSAIEIASYSTIAFLGYAFFKGVKDDLKEETKNEDNTLDNVINE